MAAIDAILKETAENRSDARKLPSKDEFLVTPLWTETKEDREAKIKDLLDAALGVVTMHLWSIFKNELKPCARTSPI